MLQKLRRNTAAKPAPEYAFCERVTASAVSPWHIRRLDEAGLKLGGGATTPTLCGRDLHKGWDLPSPVTAEDVTRLSSPREWETQLAVCSDCAKTYLAALDAADH